MPLLLLLMGTGTAAMYLTGEAVEKTGEAVEKTGNASLKSALSVIAVIASLYILKKAR